MQLKETEGRTQLCNSTQDPHANLLPTTTAPILYSAFPHK